MVKFVVNKSKCVGCGACAQVCPKGAEMETDGKAKIINSEELKKCGGEEICPFGAIEKLEE